MNIVSLIYCWGTKPLKLSGLKQLLISSCFYELSGSSALCGVGKGRVSKTWLAVGAGWWLGAELGCHQEHLDCPLSGLYTWLGFLTAWGWVPECYFCHFLLINSSHGASPDSRGRETSSTSWCGSSIHACAGGGKLLGAISGDWLHIYIWT